MSRFPELRGFSTFIKVGAALSAIAGGLLFVVSLFTGTLGVQEMALVIVSLLGALAYWIQARFIDILLQINNVVLGIDDRARAKTTSHSSPVRGGSSNVGPGIEMTIAPTAGTPGSIFTVVRLAGIGERSLVKFEWERPDGRVALLRSINAVYMSDGKLELVVPEMSAPGRYNVIVSADGRSIRVPFEVFDTTLAVSWSPMAPQAAHLQPGSFRLYGSSATATAGSSLDIFVDGVTSGDAVRLTLADGEGNGAWLKTVLPNGDGSLRTAVHLPANLPAGDYVVHAATFTHAVTWPVTVTSPVS